MNGEPQEGLLSTGGFYYLVPGTLGSGAGVMTCSLVSWADPGAYDLLPSFMVVPGSDDI